MPWVLLVLAGLLEVVWAVGLKYTNGFTRLAPSLVVGAAIAASMLLLSLAARRLPIGTAYAIWVGIGALGTVVAGVLIFGEALSWPRALFVALLLVALVGLKVTA